MISMIGIDHTTAPVDVRSLFAFRKSEMPNIMEGLKESFEAEGILILSTCNRTELWLSEAENIRKESSPEEKKKYILKEVCRVVNLNADDYIDAFIYREDEEAKEHLFWMTSGLKSAIIAEDQIISQVKDAAENARNLHFADGSLEVLFRKAVTAAKRVKTETVFHRANATAIEQALNMLAEEGFTVKNKKCLVIGNGEYGRLAAATLIEAGADVTVTIRQYHSGEVLIPKGAKAILYGDKYEVIKDCELIVSATSSPNYTLFADKLKECPRKHPMILIDLAVPRDIDPDIAQIDGCRIFDIDDFKSYDNPENSEAYKKAKAIIDEELDDFRTWYQYRNAIPLISKVGKTAAMDIGGRLEKPLRKYVAEEDNRDALTAKIENASEKVFSNLFFYLRDHLDEETFRKVLNCAWEQADNEYE